MKNSSKTELEGRLRRWWNAARALVRWKALLCVILDHKWLIDNMTPSTAQESPDANNISLLSPRYIPLQRRCVRCAMKQRTRNNDGTGGWYWTHRPMPKEDPGIWNGTL